MIYPNLFGWEEKKLWKKSFKGVVGLDEAGRGPLAGPVVSGAVLIKTKKFSFFPIKDSKKLSAKKREEFFKVLTKHPDLEWGIGIVSEKVIDKINIFQATKLAMKKAIGNLKIKNQKSKIDFLILDGNMKLDLPISQKSIIKADEKVFSCAAASIIAKVTRDRIMERYHKKYPKYRFDKHKGYPTKLHFKLLKKYGPCKIHRKSFKPIRLAK
jgi:ribonuclease HII